MKFFFQLNRKIKLKLIFICYLLKYLRIISYVLSNEEYYSIIDLNLLLEMRLMPSQINILNCGLFLYNYENYCHLFKYLKKIHSTIIFFRYSRKRS